MFQGWIDRFVVPRCSPTADLYFANAMSGCRAVRLAPTVFDPSTQRRLWRKRLGVVEPSGDVSIGVDADPHGLLRDGCDAR